MRENAASKRQQVSQGVITAYEPSNHNECRYLFSVGGRQYSGMRPAGTTSVFVGERVTVYYDSQDPTVNAIEDFSEMSRRDRNFVYIVLFVIGAVVAVILYSKAVVRKQSS